MIRVKLKIKNIRNLERKITKNLVDGPFISELNQKVITEIKRFMLAGISPVKGKRRFEKYKDKDKYPGDRKPSRPVNLKLSGDMQSELVAAKKDSGFYLGISTLASNKIKTYAKANNLGEGNIPERRFIPVSGEVFNVSIMRQIKDIIARRVSKLLKK